MANEDKPYRAAVASLLASALFFLLNFAMGDTILANVIALLLSFLAGVFSMATAAFAIKSPERKSTSIIILVCASAIVLSICVLVATDNVSVGYGP